MVISPSAFEENFAGQLELFAGVLMSGNRSATDLS
jgi:hypothetical protein